jgi:RHS repeat-associated protein
MKTQSCRFASLVIGFSLFFAAGQFARATITVESTNSFGSIAIDPSSGSVDYTAALQSSAFAQAGANAQYGSIDPSTASSTDVPVAGGLATGTGTASAALFMGSSGATGFIPGAAAGYDTSTGRASANGEFEIIGTSGPVSVTFLTTISGLLSLSSDAYGVEGQGETVFTLSVDGTPVLFNDQILTIGPDQSQNGSYSETLSASMTLTAGTPYALWVEGDSETMVVNSSVEAVPEPSESWLAAEGLAMLAFIFSVRRRFAAKAANRGLLVVLAGAILGLAAPAHAMYLGSDAPDISLTPGSQPTRQTAGSISTSLSEGNIRENYPVVTVQSAYGATLPLVLTYNSYNADGSRAQLDTGLGFGWTHTYNTLLFQQRGQMFRQGADGRMTQFYMNYTGPAGTYTSDTGYFETLTQQGDGSYYITNKYQSWWHFGPVPNTPFLVAGPVFRLLQMGDRNQNITTMTYNGGGLLASVTDPFGRALQFTYDGSNKLSTITDPLGRTTTFQYDPLERSPVQITDPLGNTTQYTYNAQYQMTRKVDRAGQMYFYTYKGLRPFMVADGLGQPWFSLANPANWAVNPTTLAFSLKRQYIPGTTTSTDGNGNPWQYSYDANGYIIQVTAPDASTTQYTYDPSTLMPATVTDADGHVTIYQYNSQGDRIQTTDALGHVTTYTYDPVFNQVTSVTDPNGRVTTFTYDGHGNEVQSVDPLGKTQSWTYDSHGNVLTSTDKNGNTTTYTYDGFGDRASMTDPLGNVTSYTYDAAGNVTSTTDPLGSTTSYQYDSDSYLTATTDALGKTTTTTYDGDGNRTSMTDRDGHVTTYTYDVRERPATTTDALGGATSTTYDGDDNRISTTDPLGRITTYQYDTQNRLITATDPLGGTTSTTYDPVGNMISQTDANGNTTTYTYDAINRQVSTTDALGGVSSTVYDADGNVLSQTDANGNTTSYTYDVINRQVSTTDALGGVSSTVYDADGNVLSQTDANGNTTTHTYDAINRQVSTTDALGGVSFTVYDADGNVLSQTDANGNTTSYTYDAINRQVSTTDALGGASSTVYDANGNVLSQTDANGNTTSHTYDAINRRVSTTDALGGASSTVYDADGNVLSQTDANGNTTSYTYDPLNRQVHTTNAVLGVTTTTYDHDGNKIAYTDPDTNTTLYTYDALNRQITMTNAVRNEAIHTYYDPVGNVLTNIDATSNVTSYTYDALNRRLSQNDSNGGVTTNIYDPVGNIVTTDDGDGNMHTYSYDALNRTVKETDALGNTTSTLYDPVGNVLSQTDANGNTTSYTYDALNRQISVVDPLLQTTITAYDPVGNPLSLTDDDGHTTTYTYDALNRRVSETYPDAPPRTLYYTYDPVGNVILETNQNGRVTTYTYDGLNLQTSQQDQSSGLTNNLTYDVSGRVIAAQRGGWVVTYTYDADGRVTNTTQNGLVTSYVYDVPGHTRTVTYPSGRTITQTYDDRGRLLTVQNGMANPPIATYTYDAADRVLSRAYGNGVLATYTYDADGRVISLQHTLGATLIAGFNYAYDSDGNKLYEQKPDNPGYSETYTYDALDRLTNYDVGTLSGVVIPLPTLQKAWTLDGVGNWLGFISNGVPQTRTYSTDNELTGINAQTLIYDGDGDLLQDPAYDYYYDQEDRLTNVVRLSDSALVAQYFYDALGRRVMKITNPNGAPATNVYYYDGNQIIEERDGANNVVATYTYGRCMDELLTMDRGGQTYYYHQNALRSPLALTGSTGNPVERYTYDVYGHVTVLDGSYNPLPLNSWGTPHSAAGSPWLFTGRQLDEETGLYFYRPRYYDPGKGQFIQRNALEMLDGASLYCYAESNPTSLMDTDGASVEINGEELKKDDKVYKGILGTNADVQSERSRLDTLIDSGKKYIFTSKKSFEDYRKLEEIVTDMKNNLAETRKAANSYLSFLGSKEKKDAEAFVADLRAKAKAEKDPAKKRAIIAQADLNEKTNSGNPLYSVYIGYKERLEQDARKLAKMGRYLKALKSLDAPTKKLLKDAEKLDEEARAYLNSKPILAR